MPRVLVFLLDMNTIQPQSLSPGDAVAIVTTARKISVAELVPAIELLKKWGLVPVLGDSIDAEDNQFGGNTLVRTTDFQAQLNNPKIKAIWCARGGYGTVKIIDNIDFSEFIKQPKWIIGFSDVTVLHAHVHRLGIQTIHALMPITVGSSTTEALQSLKNELFGSENKYIIPSKLINKTGIEEGVLVGGNLSILYSLLGSPSAIDTHGKILFIEDLDEYLYHIDRMLVNLKRNGYFEGLKGLIIGGMTKMNDNDIPFGKTVSEMILDTVSRYDFPVVFDFPAGHINNNNTLCLGKKVRLNVAENTTVLTQI